MDKLLSYLEMLINVAVVTPLVMLSCAKNITDFCVIIRQVKLMLHGYVFIL